jgi:hypothetical protein
LEGHYEPMPAAAGDVEEVQLIRPYTSPRRELTGNG